MGKSYTFWNGGTGHRRRLEVAFGPLETSLHIPERNSWRVIIVGGGMAGLSAATAFKNAGLAGEVLLIEAQPRLGGRVHTLRLQEGGHVELGAQWLHGEKENPLWDFCHQKGLLSPVKSEEGGGTYLMPGGKQIKDNIVKQIEHIMAQAVEECCQIDRHKFPNLSTGEFLRRSFEKYASDQTEERNIEEMLYDWHVRYQLIDNACSSLDELSTQSFVNFQECEGESCVNIHNGYGSLLDAVALGITPGAMLLNCPVLEVKWQPEFTLKTPAPVTIKCADGRFFAAKHVLVTCSVGVLQHHPELFNPPLPNATQRAIMSLGFGNIAKIFLQWKQPWWELDCIGFQFLWPSQQTPASLFLPEWTRFISGMDVVPPETTSGVAILVGWVGGQGAYQVEKEPEAEVGKVCHKMLQIFTGKTNIPPVEKTVRSQWGQLPFFYGAYSHRNSASDAHPNASRDLCKPVFSSVKINNNMFKWPSIMFAGEAIHPTFFSTTQGAFESGSHQAAKLLNAIQSLPSFHLQDLPKQCCL